MLQAKRKTATPAKGGGFQTSGAGEPDDYDCRKNMPWNQRVKSIVKQVVVGLALQGWIGETTAVSLIRGGGLTNV